MQGRLFGGEKGGKGKEIGGYKQKSMGECGLPGDWGGGVLATDEEGGRVKGWMTYIFCITRTEPTSTFPRERENVC